MNDQRFTRTKIIFAANTRNGSADFVNASNVKPEAARIFVDVVAHRANKLKANDIEEYTCISARSIYSAAFIKCQKVQYFAIEMHLQSQTFAIICDFIAKNYNIFNPPCIAHSECSVCSGDKMGSIATFCAVEMQKFAI